MKRKRCDYFEERIIKRIKLYEDENFTPEKRKRLDDCDWVCRKRRKLIVDVLNRFDVQRNNYIERQRMRYFNNNNINTTTTIDSAIFNFYIKVNRVLKDCDNIRRIFLIDNDVEWYTAL